MTPLASVRVIPSTQAGSTSFTSYGPWRSDAYRSNHWGFVNGDADQGFFWYWWFLRKPLGAYFRYGANRGHLVLHWRAWPKPWAIGAEGGYRIVGVYAEPFSVKHRWAPGSEWFGEGIRKPCRPCSKCSIQCLPLHCLANGSDMRAQKET